MKRVVVQIFLLLAGIHVFAQSDRIDSLLLSVLGDDSDFERLLNPPALYLYSGATCDNKTFYAGRELGDNLYNISGSTYLMHSRGYYIGVAGNWYPELDPAYNATVLSAGLMKPLNRKKNLTLRVSYSRYFFAESDSASEDAINNNVGLGLTLRNNWIGGRLSFNALFGDEFGMNLSPELFSNITLVRFGTSGKLFLAPEVSLFLGSETIEYESSGSTVDQTATYTETTDRYGLLNTQIYMPVCIYAGDFDIELGYSLNFPSSLGENLAYPVSSFLTLSLGWLLPLN